MVGKYCLFSPLILLCLFSIFSIFSVFRLFCLLCLFNLFCLLGFDTLFSKSINIISDKTIVSKGLLLPCKTVLNTATPYKLDQIRSVYIQSIHLGWAIQSFQNIRYIKYINSIQSILYIYYIRQIKNYKTKYLVLKGTPHFPCLVSVKKLFLF